MNDTIARRRGATRQKRMRIGIPRSFAWTVVWTAFLVAVFAWGLGFYGPAVYLQTLHAERGWAISTISAAITAHFLFSAILVTHLPEAHRRFGLARVTQVGIGCFALGVIAWANARAPWQLFGAALLTGAGWATTSGAAINAMVAPWFDRERAKALSLAFNGASIGGLVFTPLLIATIAAVGFPTTATIVGAAMAALLWPLTAHVLDRKPDGASAPAQSQAGETLSRAALVRDRRFVTISAAFALGLFAQIGLFAHLVTRLAPEFGANGAAWAVSLTAACAVIGRMALGWTLGERDRRVAACANFALQACGTVLLALADGVPALLAGCILFGLGAGNLVSLPPLLAQQEFGGADVGRVVALLTAINQAVFAFAPAVLGTLRDLAGDYMLAFALAAGVQAMAALIVIAHRPR
jgi:MFS family permease